MLFRGLEHIVSPDPFLYTVDESVHHGSQTPGGGKFRSSISPVPSLHSASTVQKGSHAPSLIHLSSQSIMLESSLTATAKSPAKAPVSHTNLSLAAVRNRPIHSEPGIPGQDNQCV